MSLATRSNQKEALRICAAAVERCVEQDLRTCRETQTALNWLAENGYSSAVTRFRRAFALQEPTEREAAVARALSYLHHQAPQQNRTAT